MKWKEFLVGGILAGVMIEIISIGFSSIFQMAFQYDVLSLGGMRAIDDPICILFFAYPWVLGFAMSYLYYNFEDSLGGSCISKGWKFGILMWIISSIPSAFLVFSSMDYPIGFTVNSVVGPFIYMLISGIVIAKIFDWM